MAGGTPPTIVVLDEQSAFLDLAEQALLGAGYHVLVSTDPFEVLELALRVRIDVLVADKGHLDRADIALPRKLELAQSGLRILLLRSLRMPFSLDSLLDEVSRLLGRDALPATDTPPDRLRAVPRG